MTVKNFDYKQFADDMTKQAIELVPADLKDNEKQYIVKTLNEFTLLAGKALSEDKELDLTDEQAIFITQIIAEWSYHKSIDLIKSGILPQYWDDIMKNIAFTIFEVAKQANIRKVPKDATIQAIEHQVNKVYKNAIEKLAQNNLIDEEIKNRALNQSNIDSMAQQAKEQAIREAQLKEQQKESIPSNEQQSSDNSQENVNLKNNNITNKQMKMMTLAIVLKILSQDKVTTILNKFDPKESNEIMQYMNIVNLESQIDSDLISECIKDMRSYLPIKKKLSKENILSDLLAIYKTNSREKVENVVRKERPLIKRFISSSYEGELNYLSLKIAGIVTEYIKDNI